MGQQKRIWIAIAVLATLLFSQTAHAGSVSLSWDPSTDPVAGYILQYGTESGVYTGTIDVGTLTSATIDGLDAGQTYYFVVAAYDNTGETSAPSNELNVIADGTPVGGTTSPVVISAVPAD